MAQRLKARQARPPAARHRRIFIVDDHPITRHGLTQLINNEPDLMVCGEAESSRQALALIKSREPDLLLADITMPGKSGLELIKDVRALHPAISILVLSMHDETIYAERVIRAGARGYIMKSEGGAKMLDAIRTVLGGRVYVSEHLSDQLLDRFSGRRVPAPNSALGTLTDREFEVFQNLGQGLTSHEIGRELHVSPKTVDTHRLHIKQKLGLRTMPELIKYAVRWGATQELI